MASYYSVPRKSTVSTKSGKPILTNALYQPSPASQNMISAISYRKSVIGKRNGLDDDAEDSGRKNFALQTCKDTGVGDCPACLGTRTNCHQNECQLCCEVKVCGPSFKNCPFNPEAETQTCEFLNMACKCVDPCGGETCVISDRCGATGLDCRCLDRSCNTSRHCIIVDNEDACSFTDVECKCIDKGCAYNKSCIVIDEEEYCEGAFDEYNDPIDPSGSTYGTDYGVSTNPSTALSHSGQLYDPTEIIRRCHNLCHGNPPNYTDANDEEEYDLYVTPSSFHDPVDEAVTHISGTLHQSLFQAAHGANPNQTSAEKCEGALNSIYSKGRRNSQQLSDMRGTMQATSGIYVNSNSQYTTQLGEASNNPNIQQVDRPMTNPIIINRASVNPYSTGPSIRNPHSSIRASTMNPYRSIRSTMNPYNPNRPSMTNARNTGHFSINPSTFRQSLAPSVMARHSVKSQAVSYANDPYYDDENNWEVNDIQQSMNKFRSTFTSTRPNRRFCIDGVIEEPRQDPEMYSLRSLTSKRNSAFADEPYMGNLESPSSVTPLLEPQVETTQTALEPIIPQELDYEVTLEEIPMANGETKSRISIRASPVQSRTISKSAHSVHKTSSKQIQATNSSLYVYEPSTYSSHKNIPSEPDTTPPIDEPKSLKSKASSRHIPTLAETTKSAASISQSKKSDYKVVSPDPSPDNLKQKSQVHFDIDISDHNTHRTVTLKRSIKSQSKANNLP